MRPECDAVIHELSTPTGSLDRGALAHHLAGCSKCASFSAQVDQLQRVWDLTRPTEPTRDAFDAMWSHVIAAVDEPDVIPIASAAPVWKRWGMVVLMGAQAAALLIAGGMALNHQTKVATASVLEFTAEGGTTLIVSLDGPVGVAPTVRVSDQAALASDSETDMVAVDLDVLNYMESL